MEACQLNVSLFKTYNNCHTAYKWEETVPLYWKRDNYEGFLYEYRNNEQNLLWEENEV
jgi:hypothetical protein